MARTKVLDAIVTLLADDTALKKSFQGLERDATRAGDRVGTKFTDALGKPAGGGLGQLPGRDIARTALGGSAATSLGSLGRLATSPAGLGIAAAGAALTTYVRSIKQAQEAEAELVRARTAGDLGAVTGIFQRAGEAVRDYGLNARAALEPVDGLEGAVRKGIATFKLFFAEATGRGLGQLTKEAEAAKKSAEELWRALGRPTLATAAMKREADEISRVAQASMKAAGDAMDYRAATDLLVKAKERAAAADVRTLELEQARIRLDLANGKITEAEATDRLADAEARLGGVRRQLARDVEQIRAAERRKLGEMAALEVEHTAAIEAQQRQRRDAIVAALGAVIETEASANVSLEKAFKLRAALQQEQTANAIAALEQETAGRRRALELRIGGAQGEERVKLERELSRVTAEEATKRTAIETTAAADRIRLARQTQQELRGQVEQLHAIQRTLGARTLAEDLARFTATARAAETGSKAQLDALAKVAAQVKALSEQARAFLGEALSASDSVSKRLGRGDQELVSLAGLAQDAAEQQRHLEEQQRILELGGSIRREDFSALAGGQLERLRTQRDAGRSALARSLGETGIAPSAGLATPAASFGAQLAEAFTPAAARFEDLVGSLDGLVTSGERAFQQLETVADRSFAAIVAKAEATGVVLGERLVEKVKSAIARDLDREMKLF
jgi:hypothetical protein